MSNQIPKVLDILRQHSPTVSTLEKPESVSNIQSGFPIGDSRIVTRIQSEDQAKAIYLHPSDLGSSSRLEIDDSLNQADLVILKISEPTDKLNTIKPLWTSDFSDVGDDIWIYGYRGESIEKKHISLVMQSHETRDGFPLMRTSMKSPGLLYGAIGTPALNLKTKRICGLLYDIEEHGQSDIWILPISKVKELIPGFAEEDRFREEESWRRLVGSSEATDPRYWLLNIKEKMLMLDKLASARVAGHGPEAERLREEYLREYKLKNIDPPVEGETLEIRRNQLLVKNAGADPSTPHLWRAEFWADVTDDKSTHLLLKWGMCYVNIEHGTTELLIDNRPSVWTGNEFFEGRAIKKITHNRAQDFSLTEAALVLMIRGFNDYYAGKENLKNFGGILKDDNHTNFLNEYQAIRDNCPELSIKEAAQISLKKISFGKNREKLGITKFDIAFYPHNEYSTPESIYIKSATTQSGNWEELLAVCEKWINEYP